MKKMPRKKLNIDDEIEEPSEPRIPRKSRFEMESGADDNDDAGPDYWKKREERRRNEAVSEPSQVSENVPAAGETVNENDPSAGGAEQSTEAVDSSSPLLKRGRNNNRFNKEESELNAQTSASTGAMSVLSAHSSMIPWVPLNERLKNERQILFRLSGDQMKMSTKAQSSLRDQGLNVSRFTSILSSNIDRAVVRARVRRFLQPSQIEGASDRSSTILTCQQILKDDVEIPLRNQEMIFVVPFEPYKDRACRPSMRYDPSLPYMQCR